MYWIFGAAPAITLEAQEAAEPLGFQGQLFTMVFTLGGVVACLLFAVFLYRRFMQQRMGSQNQGSIIKVVERRNLSPKSILYIVEVRSKTLLVSESPTGVVNLGEVPAALEELPEEPQAYSFTSILKRKFQSLKL